MTIKKHTSCTNTMTIKKTNTSCTKTMIIKTQTLVVQ